MPREALVDRVRRLAPPVSNGCWPWTGPIKRDGYGKIQVSGRTKSAHKVAYEVLVGQVPEGLQLDHLCRNRACVNPSHLEPVTPKVNTNRGRRANSEKETCPEGHAYDAANTYQRPLRDGKPGRGCRRCRNEAERRRKRRRRRESAA